MLENCSVAKKRNTVFKLSNYLDSLDIGLRDIGTDPANIESASSKLTGLRTPITAKDVLDDAFLPRNNTPTPFAIGRFGDGSIGVFYSALEEKTCKQEILFHTIEELNETPSRPRYYRLIECQYTGSTADLRRHELKYPCLVSETKKGYPFCQQLGLEAVEREIDGFFAPSARQIGGTCVPVFSRSSLSEPHTNSKFMLLKTAKGVELHQCDDEM